MEPEERQQAEENLSLEQSERAVFQRVFNTGDGVQVLAWILNDCGRWAMTPEKVQPELQAFANRLLAKLGAIHELNLFELAQGYVNAANDNDIAALRRMMAQD